MVTLQDSEAKNRAILNTVHSGIITMDSDKIIRDFNPAAERIFGYSADEVIGRNIRILMPEPYRENHDRFVDNYLETGRKKVIDIGRDVVGMRKDGSTFPVELAVNEMRIGSQRMFVGVLSDISLRKEAEESLLASREAAEEANRQKSEFVNIISHELRTPLTVILGNLPLLADPEDLPPPEEIAEIARDMEEDGRHLLALINDLLDIAKIESGKLALQIEPLQSSEIVAPILDTIQSLADEKGLAVKSDIPDLVVAADLLRVKQILFNLLGNAVKFTDQGYIFLRVSQQGNMACFEIEDTGCGMEPEDLPKIFDMFRQVDSSSTRKARGTGLGLAISERLVALHGGYMSVSSTPGQGSVFSFFLPLAGQAVE